MDHPNYIDYWFDKRSHSEKPIEINDFDKLLNEFSTIERLNKNYRSFLDISGYGHYENLVSNILKFLFDPTEDHGLQDLYIQSLLRCIDQNSKITSVEVRNIFRELRTDEGKRIDIVIETIDFVIGVENKIYASLYNDLDNYKSYLESVFPDKKCILIVLSMGKMKKSAIKNFKNITYSSFWRKVDVLKCNYELVDLKYEAQIDDFKLTIENMSNYNNLNPKFVELCEKDHVLINNFLKQLQSQTDIVTDLVNRVHDSLKITYKELESPWKNFVIYKDFDGKNGEIISIDTLFNLIGIEINIWIRSPKEYHLDNLSEYGYKLTKDNVVENRLIIQKSSEMKITTNFSDIVNKIDEVYQDFESKLKS